MYSIKKRFILFQEQNIMVWNNKLEKRYKKIRKESWSKLPLQVIIMMHSHNDPGWLSTYETYYSSQTRFILNTVIDSLVRRYTIEITCTIFKYIFRTADDTQECHICVD